MKSVRAAGAALAIALTALALSGCAGRASGAGSIPRGKDRNLTIDQLLQKGKALLERRKYFRARATLEQIQSRPDASRDTLADVNLLIADAYFHDGGVINLAESLSRYTSFLTFYPTHPRADYAQYHLGLSYLKQALAPDKDQATTRKALEAFRLVEAEHPASEWVGPAREQMLKCKERLAEAEVRVGLFYMKRKAWKGAVERFRSVLDGYPQYSRLDRAYFELARSLRKARRPDEALIYYRQLLERFPGSHYASDARDALGAEVKPPEKADAGGEPQGDAKDGAETPRPDGSGGRNP